jgi:hypothetical protein
MTVTTRCNQIHWKIIHAGHRNKKPLRPITAGVLIKSLAVTYFHMGKPHTIIGAKQFHFRVRDGIGWFPLANAARQTVREKGAGYIYFADYRTGSEIKQMYPAPFSHIRKVVKAGMLPETSYNTNCLGVIWSSLTGN